MSIMALVDEEGTSGLSWVTCMVNTSSINYILLHVPRHNKSGFLSTILSLCP